VWAVPRLANYTLAFALQLRKKHGKTSIKVANENEVRVANVQEIFSGWLRKLKELK
jgi:hypothetical protein